MSAQNHAFNVLTLASWLEKYKRATIAKLEEPQKTERQRGEVAITLKVLKDAGLIMVDGDVISWVELPDEHAKV